MIVPALPAAAPALLAAHDEAHRALAGRLRSVAAEARQAFVFLQRRLVIESLAYVQPVVPVDEAQLLLPPPRSFLSTTQQRRLRGAANVFRYVDSRAAMLELGTIPRVLHHTTPCVFHALLESPDPSHRETNPGMLRGTHTGWHAEVSSFVHPDAVDIEPLVDAAVAMAIDAPAPAAARAAWLTFTMLCIHPFVDGNGRTARSLYLTVVADELPGAIDWGVLEQWSRQRPGYVAALQAGQSVGRFDADRLDALPFIEFALRTSTEGADLCRRRLDALDRRLAARDLAALAPEARLVMVAVELQRNATRDELSVLGLPAETLRATVNELLGGGLLRWVPRPASRRTIDDEAHMALRSALADAPAAQSERR